MLCSSAIWESKFSCFDMKMLTSLCIHTYLHSQNEFVLHLYLEMFIFLEKVMFMDLKITKLVVFVILNNNKCCFFVVVFLFCFFPSFGYVSKLA